MTKPKVVLTGEYTKKFFADRKKTLHTSPLLTKLEKRDADYLRAAFEIFDARVRAKLKNTSVKDTINEENDNPFSTRLTPMETYELIYNYFKGCLDHAQPMTLTGIALFAGITKESFQDIIHEDMKNPKSVYSSPAWSFLADCVSFVEMYIEFTGQKKGNPVFNIFWLKNRGWKDTFDIRATSPNGALTEGERELAQKRIQSFSEIKK